MLLDLQMPLKNGLQVVQECQMLYLNKKQKNKELVEPKIVFSTAFSSRGLRKHLEKMSIKLCLEKPLTMEQFKGILEQL
jgi:CheY-like chemotaxis protein